jgi:hypothetical protein
MASPRRAGVSETPGPSANVFGALYVVTARAYLWQTFR